MVAERVERPAPQAAAAAHGEAVLGRLDLGAEAAEALDDPDDAVGLLHAQLLRAPHDRLALGEASEQPHQRQLVDREWHLLPLDDRPLERSVAAVEAADRLGRR